MTDRERNTLQYNNIDVIVEEDVESVSGISFLIKDTSLPGKAFYSFAYFDDVKRFIDNGCDWDKMIK
jgi:hypothetical protein